jgi:hypothetical protein
MRHLSGARDSWGRQGRPEREGQSSRDDEGRCAYDESPGPRSCACGTGILRFSQDRLLSALFFAVAGRCLDHGQDGRANGSGTFHRRDFVRRLESFCDGTYPVPKGCCRLLGFPLSREIPDSFQRRNETVAPPG